jgi:hypothetical protein
MADGLRQKLGQQFAILGHAIDQIDCCATDGIDGLGHGAALF